MALDFYFLSDPIDFLLIKGVGPPYFIFKIYSLIIKAEFQNKLATITKFPPYVDFGN
jgi:hypothetical protein